MTELYSVSVNDIPPEGLRATTQWSIGTVERLLSEAAPDISSVCTPLELVLSFAPSQAKIVLEGACRGGFELMCVRCLEAFPFDVDAAFQYVLWPQSSERIAKEKHLHHDELEIVYFEGDHIDLPPLAREQLFLNFPQHPHCSEKCRGLCPACGTNLNKNQCSCGAAGDNAESPFSILQRLKKQ